MMAIDYCLQPRNLPEMTRPPDQSENGFVMMECFLYVFVFSDSAFTGGAIVCKNGHGNVLASKKW